MPSDRSWPPASDLRSGFDALRPVRKGGSRRTLRARLVSEESGAALRFVLAMLFNAATVLHLGWPDPIFHSKQAHWIQFAILGVYVISMVWSERRELFRPTVTGFLGELIQPRRLVALVAVLLCWWWPALAFAGAVLLLLHFWGAYVGLLRRNISPSLVFVGSFVLLIGAGAFALKLPAATPPEHPISWLDATFTSTSAACVTGLIVRDTPQEFTRFGHLVLLALFQLGGLGVILFGSMVALLLGSSMSLKAVRAVTDTAQYGAASVPSMRRLVIFAAAVVFGLEVLGALMLYFGWPDAAGWATAPAGIDDPAERAFHAIFFSVSAFCNAGFATTSDSLEGLRLHWTTHIVIGMLITIGALGLPVYANLAQIARANLRRHGKRISGGIRRLTLHTRIAILMTLVVHVVAGLGIFLSELLQQEASWSTILLDANFMSITGTAGITTMRPETMGPFARLSLMFSMFVGGSPGSTAGGIKTIVLGVLAVTVWTAVTSRDGIHIFHRRLSEEIIRKAITLLLLHILLVTSVTGALLLTEADNITTPGGIGIFEVTLFESISACSTVGLSMGITHELSAAGRVILTIAMFVGRVGSLAFLVSLVGFAGRRKARYTYASEAVVLT